MINRGWSATCNLANGQRKSLHWTHERPVLHDVQLQNVFNVHHNIQPLTARLHPSNANSLTNSQVLPSLPRLAILDLTDMVLDRMAQLFQNDDGSDSLRDLSDLDLLLRHFGRVPAFWPQLIDRGRETGLARPLHYGLRFAHRLLATPVPPQFMKAAATGGPNWAVGYLSDLVWTRALRSQHATASDSWSQVALFALRARTQWQRIQPLLALRLRL